MGISQKPKLTSISQSMKGKWERKNQIYLFMFFVLCRSNESDFHYIKSYCPYQNIRDKVWFSLVFLFFWLLDTGEGGGVERGHSFESGVLPEIYYGGVSLSPRDSGPVADTKRQIGILFLKPAQGQIEEWGVPKLD